MEKGNKRLRGRIVEKYDTIGAFAKTIGLSRVSTSAKLNGTVRFNSDDIRKWSEILEITPDEIGKYFFE